MVFSQVTEVAAALIVDVSDGKLVEVVSALREVKSNVLVAEETALMGDVSDGKLVVVVVSALWEVKCNVLVAEEMVGHHHSKEVEADG